MTTWRCYRCGASPYIIQQGMVLCVVCSAQWETDQETPPAKSTGSFMDARALRMFLFIVVTASIITSILMWCLLHP